MLKNTSFNMIKKCCTDPLLYMNYYYICVHLWYPFLYIIHVSQTLLTSHNMRLHVSIYIMLYTTDVK